MKFTLRENFIFSDFLKDSLGLNEEKSEEF